MCDFIDVFLLGETEESICEMLELIPGGKRWKTGGGKEIIEECKLAMKRGCYIAVII